jgi:hypothetical protein
MTGYRPKGQGQGHRFRIEQTAKRSVKECSAFFKSGMTASPTERRAMSFYHAIKHKLLPAQINI